MPDTVDRMAEVFDWPAALAADGARRDEAIGALHALLLRAARFELVRRRVAPADLDDLATQSADDALVAILAKLDTWRGESRFTTWAYKFALLEAGVKARRRSWQDRELPLDDEGWGRLAAATVSPGASARTSELLAVIGELIATALTAHQREVLVALALNEVPIDVLAERRQTTRGALYKTLHDARRRLRAELARRGFDLREGEDT